MLSNDVANLDEQTDHKNLFDDDQLMRGTRLRMYRRTGARKTVVIEIVQGTAPLLVASKGALSE